MSQFRVWALVLGLALAVLIVCGHAAGCGGDNPLGRKAVYGKVTLNGAPLASGAIEFHPLVQSGVQSGGIITDGRYSIAAEQGLTAGKYRVAILDNVPTPPLPAGHMPGDDLPPSPPPQVPAEWNSQSQQTIDFSADGPYEFNFDINTKK